MVSDPGLVPSGEVGASPRSPGAFGIWPMWMFAGSRHLGTGANNLYLNY